MRTWLLLIVAASGFAGTAQGRAATAPVASGSAENYARLQLTFPFAPLRTQYDKMVKLWEKELAQLTEKSRSISTSSKSSAEKETVDLDLHVVEHRNQLERLRSIGRRMDIIRSMPESVNVDDDRIKVDIRPRADFIDLTEQIEKLEEHLSAKKISADTFQGLAERKLHADDLFFAYTAQMSAHLARLEDVVGRVWSDGHLAFGAATAKELEDGLIKLRKEAGEKGFKIIVDKAERIWWSRASSDVVNFEEGPTVVSSVDKDGLHVFIRMRMEKKD